MSATPTPVLNRPAPNAGGDEEIFERERASATPRTAPSAPMNVARAVSHKSATTDASLAAMQQWFMTVITDPNSVAHGLARAQRTLAGQVVVDGPTLHAAGCLSVYHFAYHARLVECLLDDFPCVNYLCGELGGEDSFEQLARTYIHAHPSRHPNLNGYGAGFAPWLRRLRRPVLHRALLAEVAALEWALVEVLHAEAAPLLDPQALAAIPLEKWGDLRLQPAATVRLLKTTYAVNPLYQAWRTDEPLVIPPAVPATVAVYRECYALWRMDCSPLTAGLLRDLFTGRPLGVALARCARAGSDVPDLVPRVMEWFRTWVASGFFARIG